MRPYIRDGNGREPLMRIGNDQQWRQRKLIKGLMAHDKGQVEVIIRELFSSATE